MVSNPEFTDLVEAHYASLFRFGLSLTRREADACDLTQQAFYLLAQKGDSLRDRSKAKTWLFTTLYREFLRGKRRDERKSSLEDLPPSAAELRDEEIDLVARCDGASLLECLGKVDETFRVPLSLFYLEDLSYQEIAEALEVPIGTVMSRLARGKSLLRQALQQLDAKIIPFPKSRSGGAS